MAFKNFAYSTVLTAPSPATSGLSLVVQSGDGAKFPAHSFRAVVWPAGAQALSTNAEIVQVTSISTDTFTIVRTQESSTNRSIIVGDQIAMAELSSLQPAGLIQPYAARIAPIGWLNCDGSAVSRTTYVDLFGAISPSLGAFTVTVAAPGVVSLTAHGLSTGDQVYLTTTGALPTGLVANTLYYVVRVDANSFNLATSRANAYAGTKITTTGTQSGTHTAFDCPYGLGDGSTTFTLPDLRGRTPSGLDTTGGSAASRLTLAQSQGVYGNLGASGGEQGHTLVTGELASHTHLAGGVYTTAAGASVTGTGVPPHNGVSSGNSFGPTSSTTGSDTAHNTVSPTQLVNYIIKA